MEYKIFDFKITDNFGEPNKVEIVLLKEDDCGNCFGINRLDWPDTAFYLLTDDAHFRNTDLHFLGDDNEELGYCNDYNYYSVNLGGMTYYISHKGGTVKLIDIDRDTHAIDKLKVKIAFNELSLDKIEKILMRDGSRGLYLKIDELLRMS